MPLAVLEKKQLKRENSYMDKENLKKEIFIEKENLERLIDEMNRLIERIGGKPSFVEVRAAASILHDFYSGIEKIFERIAVTVDKDLPKGEDWHIELLLLMAKPYEGIRDLVITEALLQKLKGYMRFRHLFRHIYGFELKWERFNNLCFEMGNLFNELTSNLTKFLDKLEIKQNAQKTKENAVSLAEK